MRDHREGVEVALVQNVDARGAVSVQLGVRDILIPLLSSLELFRSLFPEEEADEDQDGAVDAQTYF